MLRGLVLLCGRNSLSLLIQPHRFQRILSTFLFASSTAAAAFSTTASPVVVPTMNANIHMEDFTIPCSNGITLAGQSYTNPTTMSSGSGEQRRILCLHGWMDNCRSYYWLAPYILQQQYTNNTHIVALDFVGHGHSDHMAEPGCVLAEHLFYVAEALRVMEWPNNVTLIGHSMGAAVACLYAAAFPEQVDKLILLEGAGPLARDPMDTAKHVRSHITKRLRAAQQQPQKPTRMYDSIELAVATRQKTATTWPGNQTISAAASRQLVERGVTRHGPTQVQFRHDPRLSWPSIQYMTTEQVHGIYKDVQCPTALLLAMDGWPFDSSLPRNKEGLELLQPRLQKTLPGSHHFHMDPETAEAVAREVVRFL